MLIEQTEQKQGRMIGTRAVKNQLMPVKLVDFRNEEDGKTNTLDSGRMNSSILTVTRIGRRRLLSMGNRREKQQAERGDMEDPHVPPSLALCLSTQA